MKNLMIPTAKSGRPRSTYIIDRPGGGKISLHVLVLQEKKNHGEDVYFLTDPHAFLKSQRWVSTARRCRTHMRTFSVRLRVKIAICVKFQRRQ